VSGLSVTCNSFSSGAGIAIRINDAGFLAPTPDPNSNITIHSNNISGYPVAGLEVDTAGYTGGPGSLNATNDWWGSSTGPTIASNPGGTGEPIVDPDGVVTYKPFLTSRSTCAPPPPPCHLSTSIKSNFNGTQINKNSYIWFTSVLKPSGLGSQPVTIRFTQQTINQLSVHSLCAGFGCDLRSERDFRDNEFHWRNVGNASPINGFGWKHVFLGSELHASVELARRT
jgi:hypothetical protein